MVNCEGWDVNSYNHLSKYMDEVSSLLIFLLNNHNSKLVHFGTGNYREVNLEVYLRPALDIKLFPVDRPSGLKRADWK